MKWKIDFSRKEIYDFVMTYCFSPLFSTLEELALSYDISKQTAKSLIYTAIAECIVEDDAVNILCQKAYQRAFMHSCQDKVYKAPSATYGKYEELKKLRKSFCFSDEQITEIILLYLTSSFDKTHFCTDYPMTKALFDRTLKKAIIHGLVSDDVVEDLYQKALSFSKDSSRVNALFEKLRKARLQYQEQHI
ncbi:MAG: hypothetical protein HFJ28_04330 [Clostridia bacterium]|jgi:hypothetical protein|nr:hypothetical protein [Clostridia bacterium]